MRSKIEAKYLSMATFKISLLLLKELFDPIKIRGGMGKMSRCCCRHTCSGTTAHCDILVKSAVDKSSYLLTYLLRKKSSETVVYI